MRQYAQFKNNLLGFAILTDSKALTYYLTIENQTNITTRWTLNIQEFDFRVEHIGGELNPADYNVL